MRGQSEAISGSPNDLDDGESFCGSGGRERIRHPITRPSWRSGSNSRHQGISTRLEGVCIGVRDSVRS